MWAALTEPELVRQWRFGLSFDTDWQPGSKLISHNPAGTGAVLDAPPGQWLVYDWIGDDDPDANAGQASPVSFELTELGTVQATCQHDHIADEEALLPVVASGWPRILSSLKSLLETGEPLARW